MDRADRSAREKALRWSYRQEVDTIDSSTSSEEKVQDKNILQPNLPLSGDGRRDIAAEVKRDLRREAKSMRKGERENSGEKKRADELAAQKDMKRRARAQMIERSPLMPLANTMHKTKERKTTRNKAHASVRGRSSEKKTWRPCCPHPYPLQPKDPRKIRRKWFQSRLHHLLHKVVATEMSFRRRHFRSLPRTTLMSPMKKTVRTAVLISTRAVSPQESGDL